MLLHPYLAIARHRIFTPSTIHACARPLLHPPSYSRVGPPPRPSSWLRGSPAKLTRQGRGTRDSRLGDTRHGTGISRWRSHATGAWPEAPRLALPPHLCPWLAWCDSGPPRPPEDELVPPTRRWVSSGPVPHEEEQRPTSLPPAHLAGARSRLISHEDDGRARAGCACNGHCRRPRLLSTLGLLRVDTPPLGCVTTTGRSYRGRCTTHV